MSFKVYIPARFASTRLPGKMLAEIGGKPMLQHVHERALESGAAEVVVATDDERIAEIARSFGATVCLTDPALQSGTDRIAAAAAQRHESDGEVIVNLQGDEPFMPAVVIAQVALSVADDPVIDMATVCEPVLLQSEFENPNVVKVVRTPAGRALYFSRTPIPFLRDGTAARWTPGPLYRRHVGIYAYRVAFLRRFVAWPAAALETAERLEQLRALANDASILVVDAKMPCGMGVDTAEDLIRAQRLAQKGK